MFEVAFCRCIFHLPGVIGMKMLIRFKRNGLSGKAGKMGVFLSLLSLILRICVTLSLI